MTAPAEYNLKVYKGVTFTQAFRLQNSDGSVLSLTGCTVRMVIVNQDGTNPLFTLTSPSAGITVDTNTGRIVVTLSAAQTAAIAARTPRQFYHVSVTDGNGVVTRYLQGYVEVLL